MHRYFELILFVLAIPATIAAAGLASESEHYPAMASVAIILMKIVVLLVLGAIGCGYMRLLRGEGSDGK